MEIILKNYIIFSVVYDGHNKLCKIIKNPFIKRRRCIYDTENKVRYITEIQKNRNSISNEYNYNYQIIKKTPQATMVVGTAELVHENNVSNDFMFRPPFVNKMEINLFSEKKVIYIFLNRNGSCVLKNEKGIIIGNINKQLLKGYRVEYLERINVYELCAIFILSRYLDEENDFIIV